MLSVTVQVGLEPICVNSIAVSLPIITYERESVVVVYRG